MPLFRIEKLQRPFGVPMPVGTQWELLRDAARLMMPVFEALVHIAAQACLFFHDDTRMKVLSLMKENSSRAENGGKERTGMFTTRILAQAGEHRIVLFFTGRKHAGENLEKVLEQRSAELPAPIQMCDGASSNRVQEGKTVEANCAAHSRRKFVEVLESFPEESRFVIESFREVYRNDAEARELRLCAEERLRFHQERSLETMHGLERWAREQIEQKKVEPNSVSFWVEDGHPFYSVFWDFAFLIETQKESMLRFRLTNVEQHDARAKRAKEVQICRRQM
jgi:transposase